MYCHIHRPTYSCTHTYVHTYLLTYLLTVLTLSSRLQTTSRTRRKMSTHTTGAATCPDQAVTRCVSCIIPRDLSPRPQTTNPRLPVRKLRMHSVSQAAIAIGLRKVVDLPNVGWCIYRPSLKDDKLQTDPKLRALFFRSARKSVSYFYWIILEGGIYFILKAGPLLVKRRVDRPPATHTSSINA